MTSILATFKQSLYGQTIHDHLTTLIISEMHEQGGYQVTIPASALSYGELLPKGELHRIAAQATEKFALARNHQKMRVVYIPKLRWFLAVDEKFIQSQNEQLRWPVPH